MPSMRNGRTCALAGALSLIVLGVSAGEAQAGEFQVATCQADSLTFTTRPFEDFATRGMKIRRACNPEGPGLRGLVTANVLDHGRVRRGARAIATITAPTGTRFTSFRWAGALRRRDCRYALQLYADAPDIAPISVKSVPANQQCPKPRRGQAAGFRAFTYNVTGATQIVQRVICVGGRGRQSCSARGANFIRTDMASFGIADGLPPAVAILQDTPLARGEWVSGTQPLNYDANDNVGVRFARAHVGALELGTHDRPCLLASPQGPYADRVPCPNGLGRIDLNTKGVPDGTQPLTVQAQDAAGNVANTGQLTARIDNTPPPRVDVSLAGGEAWRNRNEFLAAWTNTLPGDAAPITAASYKLCAADGGSCRRSQESAANIAQLHVAVPAPGVWALSVWQRDAAGNEAEDNASVPVTLRYDPEPPQLAFEPAAAADPTLVGVQVTDRVSGVANGSIEISRDGSGTWQTLSTERQADRLIARIDDATLPAGTYALRARAADHAGNEGSTALRVDGQPMLVTLPLRVTATMRAGVEQRRIVRRTVRRHGRRRQVRRRITVLRPVAHVKLGKQAQIAGQLITPNGQGIAAAQIQVLARSQTAPEELAGIVQTDANGHYRYSTTGTSTRTLRLVYGGSALVLPTQSQVELLVPAVTSLRVNRKRVVNGQSVRFTGQVRARPVPPGGKLVELQVRLSGRWQTFRTMRSDPNGRWSIPYRFRRTRGVQHYRFRVRLPSEAGYPFETGASRSLRVRVRGVR